jgi:hypothetical protein
MGVFEVYIAVFDAQIIVESGRISPFLPPKRALLGHI